MSVSILMKIKKAQLEARKNKDGFRANILTTLYSECSIIGKNAGNRETTDEECIKCITKFKKGVNETLVNLKNKITYPEKIKELNDELSIYEEYLPVQMSEDDLTKVIKDIIDVNSFKSMKDMGSIMKMLKAQYSGTYDGKKASEIIKFLL